MFSATDFAARLAKREDRWSLLKDFIAEWHSPLEPGDGYSAADIDAAEQRLGLKLPIALREWYALAGQREDVVATQNFLVGPDELEFEEGLLEFHSENQGVVYWGIKPDDLHLPDPPVYLNDSELHDEPEDDDPQELIRENETLSEFALQMVLCETIITQDRAIMMQSPGRDTIARVEREYVRFGFPEWHWPEYPVRFYGAEDTLAMIVGGESIYLAASTHAAYNKAKELLESE